MSVTQNLHFSKHDKDFKRNIMRKLRLFLLATILLSAISCRKDISNSITTVQENEYLQWLTSNGGSYKNGVIKTQTSQNEIITGELNWSSLIEYQWEGVTYADIPYEFNGKRKIEGNGAISPTSFTLVIRKKTGEEWDAAIRTTSYGILLNNKRTTIESYQSLNGVRLNIWQKNSEEKNIHAFIEKSRLNLSTINRYLLKC